MEERMFGWEMVRIETLERQAEQSDTTRRAGGLMSVSISKTLGLMKEQGDLQQHKATLPNYMATRPRVLLWTARPDKNLGKVRYSPQGMFFTWRCSERV
jgi:hypothetical protein